MKMPSRLAAFLLTAGAAGLLTGCVYHERVYHPGPPQAPVAAFETPGEEVPVGGPPPAIPPSRPPTVTDTTISILPGSVWINPYWSWEPSGWVWVDGYWGRPPRAGVIWVGPGVVYRGDRYYYHRGYWR